MAISFQSTSNQLIAEGIKNASGSLDSLATFSGESMPEVIRNQISDLIAENITIDGDIPSEIITAVAEIMHKFTPTLSVTELSKILLTNSLFGQLSGTELTITSIIQDNLGTFMNQYNLKYLEIIGGFSAVLGNYGISDGLAAITDKLSGDLSVLVTSSLGSVLSVSELSKVSPSVVATFLKGDGIINLITDLPEVYAMRPIPHMIQAGIMGDIEEGLDSGPLEDFNIDLDDQSDFQRDNFAAAYVKTSSGTEVPFQTLTGVMGKTRGTIAGTVEQTEILPGPNPFLIDADTINPSGSFISSVEELESEMASITRDISEVIVHWSETYTNANLSGAQLTELTGAGDNAYHFIIRRDGALERGVPLNVVGAHCDIRNHDQYSLGVCFVGGLNVSTGSSNVYDVASSRSLTLAQYNTFYQIMRVFFLQYPGGQALGHMDIDPGHEDPGFDVRDYVQTNFNKQSLYSNPESQPALSPTDIIDKDATARTGSGNLVQYTEQDKTQRIIDSIQRILKGEGSE